MDKVVYSVDVHSCGEVRNLEAVFGVKPRWQFVTACQIYART